jgi:peptide-methionine (S)-S-oxide reductase
MATESASSAAREIATLGGGCFWCLEAVFVEVKGVEKVESGYAGGTVHNPTYRDVCSGSTGHAEVVQITFNPSVITYRELLEIFFTVHDPTTLNRQGADVGSQYRSVIFYHSEEQKRIAEKVMHEVDRTGLWPGPIVTQLEPAPVFYKAENYHQNYFALHPEQAYCQAVVAPKVAKLRIHYADKLKG